MELLWVVTGLIAVFGFTAVNLIQKRFVSSLSAAEVSFLTHGYAAMFALPLTLYLLPGELSAFTADVIAAALFTIAANIALMFLYTSALEIEDVSVVSALLGTSPLYVAAIF